ncbi:hypothetical protein [Flavobacterium sp.]|uniref:hypothetical protein n=1 Tax=Flavobacterium sp. TaxID=239 RepID=UPI00260807AE|nr:hypothetical protein [Flavobacterium sp.]
MKYLEILRLKLIKKYDELGLRASGKYEQELEAQVEGNKLLMLGAGHSEYMEHGREAGKFPPRSMISDWIDTKEGLPAVFREKKDQFVFLVSRKIARDGIRVPNQYNLGGVVSSVLEDWLANELEQMLKEVGEQYYKRLQSDIVQLIAA